MIGKVNIMKEVNFKQKKKLIRTRGVSLLEALVSTAIIGIGFVAILQMTNYSVQSVYTSGERTKANYLSNMIAEDVIGNKTAGGDKSNFSEYLHGETDLGEICTANNPGSDDNSGNIYGGATKANALIPPEMKLRKWKAILNSRDYMNCVGKNETRKFRIFKIKADWATGAADKSNPNIKDEMLYIGRVQIKLNDGKKTKYLYFQSDYKLKGPQTLEEETLAEEQDDIVAQEEDEDKDG